MFAKDVDEYRENGYLVKEAFLDAGLLAELQTVTRRIVDDVAAGVVSDPRLDAVTTDEGPGLRRIVDPEQIHPAYDRAMRDERLLDLVAALLGGTVRFDHGKLNFKPPGGGAAVQWHQDWGFYPQTNDDMLAVGIMLEDCTADNGPLLVVPGSHRGPAYDHHQGGRFVGGVAASGIADEISRAVPLLAPAGSISIHHVRMLHGSTVNLSDRPRPLLLFNYVAVDAFPIFHRYDWDEFNGRILRGEPTPVPRIEPVPVRIPEPTPPPADGYVTGSLFELQEEMVEPTLG